MRLVSFLCSTTAIYLARDFNIVYAISHISLVWSFHTIEPLKDYPTFIRTSTHSRYHFIFEGFYDYPATGLVPTVGIEPTTFGVWIRRSSQLSYTGILESLNILLERFHLRPTRALADAWGFEPHITMRDFYCCFAGRIWTINHSDEPVSNYTYETSMLTKIGIGPSGETWTHGLLIPNQALCQTELHPDVELTVGVEPTTYWLQVSYATNCATPA